ncbi:leucine-rich repeat domain-containing protein [Pseudomonas urmiensis]|uniref:RING-type E3 ubiquitin transferase n=1 Tax=Pseudomonas urmiensis TaxID=2745493 RepID=A0ABW8NQ09_9PSED
MSHALPHHLALIHQRMPSWLQQSTLAQRSTLKSRLQLSHKATRKLEQAMASIQSVETFCRPLLHDALKSWYPGQTLPQVDQAVLSDRTPGHHRSMSWLEAALQNLKPDTPIWLYPSADGARMALDTSRFVKGIRNLDLGQRYLNHLRDHVDNDIFRSLLRAQDHAAFAAELSCAQMQGRLDSRGQALGEAALAGAVEIPSVHGSARLQCGYLSVLGVPLSGPLLVRREPQGQTEPCLLYLPGDQQGAVRQYPSLQAAGAALTRRLWNTHFRQFFTRYVSHAQRPTFIARLRQRLYPRYPYATLHPTPPVLEKGQSFSWIKRAFPAPHELWQETLDKNARLSLTFTQWPGNCFTARASNQVQSTLDDAVTLAVPTAQLDAQAQRERILGWFGVGLTVLNVVSLFLPGLAQVMLVIGGAQIVNEFLEGVHALEEGETDAAIEHLFEVFDSLVQFAVLGAAHAAIEPPGPLEHWTSFAGKSSSRLWHGDLKPFSELTPWPAGTASDGQGLHLWQGKHWLSLEGKALPVEQNPEGGWQLAPAKGHRYQPRMLGNGQIPWQFEHEQPLAWNTAKLLRRIARCEPAVSDETLLRALRCSGYSEAALRRVMVDQQAAPAMLLDSLQALDATGAAGPESRWTDASALAHDFPSLSSRARAEILAKADAKDVTQMQQSGRLPLSIAETARVYLREARIDRALQRFYQQSGPAQDRDALIFGTLEQLPGWTNDVRLELRQGSPHGPLLKACGAEGRPVKTLVRSAQGYQPYDERGQALASKMTIYQAILNALPDTERVAMKLEIHQPLRLRDALFEKASIDRRHTARQLGLAPVRPLYRLPTRLPQERRIGYSLSGRGQGWTTDEQAFDALFPSREPQDREWLRQRLREEAGNSPGAFSRLLERLRTDLQRLNRTLDTWINDPEGIAVGALEQRKAARTEAARRIRQAWRREGQPGDVGLILQAEHLGPLPNLPSQLEHVRVLMVNGSHSGEAMNMEGFLQAFPRVQLLDISSNMLRWLPEPIAQMRELQALDVAENFLPLDGERNLNVLTRLARLQRLNLTDAAENLPVAALQRLAQLQHLQALQLDLNTLTLQTEHFQALHGWPALSELSLGSNAITLTAESRAALAQLTRLRSLRLGENPLQLAPDVTGWQHLESLDLDQCELSEWPQGLPDLMGQRPLVLRSLDLSGNRLVDAPALHDSAFAEAIRNREEQTFYDFDGNPFNEQAQLNLRDAGLAAIPDLDALDVSPEQAWAIELPDDLQAQRQANAEDPMWAPLYRLFERMVDTPEYVASPPRMRERIVHILRVLGLQPVAGEDGGWGLAQLQQQLVNQIDAAAQACVDQASLLFQQVETEVSIWRAVSTAQAGAGDEAVAVSVATAMARQSRLDGQVAAVYDARVARRNALAAAEDDAARQAAPVLHPDDDLSDALLSNPQSPLDEIEMALVARIYLADRLGLPEQPGQIAFGYLANLSEATLERLAVAVEGETDARYLAHWASEQRFWQAWIRRLRPVSFEALARDWEAASEYFNELSEATSSPGPYSGPAVPERFIAELERQTQAVPGLVWRIDGVLQRIDLVSNRYPGESGLYELAGRLLLSTRRQAEHALYAQLAEELFHVSQA